ncbi:MAG: YraN family protein [Deltaproteobacteria bacterium]|nr:YraN family protein [Deltaproteobacteria bacterium]
MEKKPDLKPGPSTRERGLAAELLVRRHLVAGGFAFIESNFYWKGGELDLIFLDQAGVLVFVEVRSAADDSAWLRYTVSGAKQRRLINTALRYRMIRDFARRLPYRFDMAWVEGTRVEHWKNVLMT